MSDSPKNLARIAAIVVAVMMGSSGVLGMLASFFFLASADPADLTAGAAGIVAGAVLVAGATVASAILARD